jgi:hypothetical protein
MRRSATALLGSALVALCACAARQGGGEADALRRRVADLEADNQKLSRRVRELEASAAPAGAIPPEIRALTPAVIDLEVGRLSHLVDRDGDGAPEGLRAYVLTRDQLGRFVQAVGSLGVSVIAPRPGSEAATVGRCTLSPMELRQAYRSGITGTHYSIECPVTWDGVPVQSVLLAVRFTDALSGRQFDAERPVAWP